MWMCEESSQDGLLEMEDEWVAHFIFPYASILGVI
jgi:hypothetical protein